MRLVPHIDDGEGELAGEALCRDPVAHLVGHETVEGAAESSVGTCHEQQELCRASGRRQAEPVVLGRSKLGSQRGQLLQLLAEGHGKRQLVLRAMQVRGRDHLHGRGHAPHPAHRAQTYIKLSKVRHKTFLMALIRIEDGSHQRIQEPLEFIIHHWLGVEAVSVRAALLRVVQRLVECAHGIWEARF